MTLKTYAHLWPDANDRTRKAAGELMDETLLPGDPEKSVADQLRTEGP